MPSPPFHPPVSSLRAQSELPRGGKRQGPLRSGCRHGLGLFSLTLARSVPAVSFSCSPRPLQPPAPVLPPPPAHACLHVHRITPASLFPGGLPSPSLLSTFLVGAGFPVAHGAVPGFGCNLEKHFSALQALLPRGPPRCAADPPEPDGGSCPGSWGCRGGTGWWLPGEEVPAPAASFFLSFFCWWRFFQAGSQLLPQTPLGRPAVPPRFLLSGAGVRFAMPRIHFSHPFPKAP